MQLRSFKLYSLFILLSWGCFLQTNAVDTRLDSLGNQAVSLLKAGEKEEAGELLEQIKLDANVEDKALLEYWEARYLLGEGKKELGIAKLVKAKEEAIQIGDTVIWARTLMYLTQAKERQFDVEWGREQLRLAVQLLAEVKDSIGLIKGHYDLGTGFCQSGAIDSCQFHLGRAQTYAFYSKNWVKLATVLNYRGINLFNRGLYEESIPYCLGSLKIYEEKEIYPDVARTFNLLGSTLQRIGDNESSISYYRKGLAVAQREGLDETEANILGNLGVLLQETGNSEEPLAHYQRSLKLHRQLDNKVGESAMLTNIAILYEQKKEFALAIQYQEEALAIDQSIQDPYGETISQFNLGDFHRQIGHTDLALKHFKVSEGLAKQLGFQSMFPELYDRYAKIYKAQSNFELALQYTEKCDSIEALTATSLKTDSARADVFAYEVEKKKEELSDLKDVASKTSTTLKSILLISGILVLLLVAFGIWMFIRQKSNKAKLGHLQEDREDLKQRNQTLAENVEHLAQNLEAKEGLINQLQTQGDGNSEGMAAFLMAKVKENNLWPGYMAEFEILYPGFVDRLAKNFPSLNQNDLRLLSLIKLNLNSAEIAEFLNITPAGVKKGRQRIRKKMDLPSEQNLGQFLNQV